MKAPTYALELRHFDGTTDTVTVKDARLALQLVDLFWSGAGDSLEIIVIMRNGRPYLGCPRPQ